MAAYSDRKSGHHRFRHQIANQTNDSTIFVCGRQNNAPLSAPGNVTSSSPWTAAHRAPLSMRFSRQGCWCGLPFPFPGVLPNPEIEPGSPALQADSLPTKLQEKPSNSQQPLNLENKTFLNTAKRN